MILNVQIIIIEQINIIIGPENYVGECTPCLCHLKISNSSKYIQKSITISVKIIFEIGFDSKLKK